MTRNKWLLSGVVCVWMFAIPAEVWGQSPPSQPRDTTTGQTSPSQMAKSLGGSGKSGDISVSADQVKKGMELLKSRSCLACHSLDGSSMPGPTLYRLFGKDREVLTQGQWRKVVANEIYLRQAILEPDADRVKGYEQVMMPKLPMSATEVDAVVAAIRSLNSSSPQASSFWLPPRWIWTGLIFFSILFVFGHLGLSSLPVRQRIIAAWGEKKFLLLYSVVAVVAMSGLIYFWSKAPYLELWKPYTWTRYVPFVTMPLICYLFIWSFMVKNPTSAGQEKALHQGDTVQGILKITRHPGLWSFALWGVVHLFPNGDLGSVFLFGSIIVLAFAGMLHIESRRRITQGEAWVQFTERTSLVPFAALMKGKIRYSWQDIGVWPVVLSVGFYLLALWTHQYSIGVSPWPW